MARTDQAGVEEGREDREGPSKEIVQHQEGSQIPFFGLGHSGDHSIALQEWGQNIEKNKVTSQLYRTEELWKSHQLLRTLQGQPVY